MKDLKKPLFVAAFSIISFSASCQELICSADGYINVMRDGVSRNKESKNYFIKVQNGRLRVRESGVLTEFIIVDTIVQGAIMGVNSNSLGIELFSIDQSALSMQKVTTNPFGSSVVHGKCSR